MDIDVASDLGRHALYMTILVSLPAMLTGLLVGIAISLIQSVTSIQDQTLSLVPKIVVTLIVAVLALPWTMNQLMEYTLTLYYGIPDRF